MLREIEKNGSFFFVAGSRHRRKFSRKRVLRPIAFFCCFELSNKFLYVNKNGPILSNMNLTRNRDYNHGAVMRI